MILLAFTLASLVSGAAITLSISNRLFARDFDADNPPCPYSYTPFTYKGCYDDSAARILPYVVHGLDSSKMTPDYCQAACKANYLKYAGVEYYRECYCGASLSATLEPELDCSYPCVGDSSKICGGASRLSVWEDETFPPVSPGASTGYTSKGCYSEAAEGRALAVRQTLDSDSMTVETCLTACKSDGYPLAGTEYYSECYCGLTLAAGSEPVSPDNCDTPCNGNSSQICGGSDHISFFVNPELMEGEPCDPSMVQQFPTYGDVAAMSTTTSSITFTSTSTSTSTYTPSLAAPTSTTSSSSIFTSSSSTSSVSSTSPSSTPSATSSASLSTSSTPSATTIAPTSIQPGANAAPSTTTTTTPTLTSTAKQTMTTAESLNAVDTGACANGDPNATATVTTTVTTDTTVTVTVAANTMLT